jgi:hypothetical protein
VRELEDGVSPLAGAARARGVAEVVVDPKGYRRPGESS